ncbi:MAG: bifunctional fucokinase/L-fucose-1-P-guanylyltransferase, partial [Marinilabiliaceae bacterium]|nr:bifunctional fucokinase/L-fucose-1-P-guanylyltransferase [Marinilabiliaceae bacterium]
MKTLISIPENLVEVFNDILPLGSEDRFVSSDPAGKKVGSGGGTAWLLARQFNKSGEKNFNSYLAASKKIIIHAGGQSRRLPSYAPGGKLLTPIPVFRWSRGQSLRQNLLDLQMPLYEEMMQVAPKNVNTLIASGDVLILSEQTFSSLPDADVICLAIWADPHLASRHGVYFTSKEDPGILNFMLQKPSHEAIEKHASTNLFLMDVGVWLLSDKAVNVLMKKCGWESNGFENEIPIEYDFYSAFGPCLGTQPTVFDVEISNLSVAIIPLDKGEFLHYGTSRELITSTEKIQNRVKDQRNIWHTRVKPQPSLFVQNAITSINWDHSNHDIWIENSFISSKWKLHNSHILTGIPLNDWQLEVPCGICIDVVPIGEKELAVRPYGMDDAFSGLSGNAFWMGKPLTDWLSERHIDWAEANLNPRGDIQSTPIFPVISMSLLNEELIKWMIGSPDDNVKMRALWLNSPRYSAEQISAKANLIRLTAQRES